MHKTEIPVVDELAAIQPANLGQGGSALIYEDLPCAADTYARSNAARSNVVWDSPTGSLQESGAARQLALEGLVRTAQKAVEATDLDRRDMWADRFTQASIELYGEPTAEEASHLITEEYHWLQSLKNNPNISQKQLDLLNQTYEPIVAIAHERFDIALETDSAEREQEAIVEYGQAIHDKYQPLFDLITKASQPKFEAKALRELFEKAHDWLVDNDGQEWADWRVIGGNGTSPVINPSEKTIKVPDNCLSVSAKNLPGLLTHELLVHALRSKNGYSLGDQQLGEGLAGYGDIEEGLAILAEQAVSGKVLQRPRDRYVDIALALGSVDGRQRTRRELFEITLARRIVHLQAQGTFTEAKLPRLERLAWNRVDRIYRGGSGDDNDARQAVFTKDIIYYTGYRNALEYLVQQLEDGKTAGEVFDYVSKAKFDPTNSQHAAMVNRPTA